MADQAARARRHPRSRDFLAGAAVAARFRALRPPAAGGPASRQSGVPQSASHPAKTENRFETAFGKMRQECRARHARNEKVFVPLPDIRRANRPELNTERPVSSLVLFIMSGESHA